eukprot:TRINITY_DN6786_c0_g1_i16.p1 TRINITY_DN6786_c0_g1~~TRINITY_DN6786_c0_g1_i16.p1  ORF type:complete len:236 (-),score=12.30 TRINITY_DN6786_c0_g1_i16:362-1069(-)
MDYEYRPLLFEDNLSPELTSKEKLIASLYLGVCFCLLFLSYTTTLFLLTTFFGLYGFYAILIICGLFILVSPASSFVVYWMGIEKAMSASAFGYGIFIACCLVAKQVNHPFIILIGAIPIGLGAAILWGSSGINAEYGEVQIPTNMVKHANRRTELLTIIEELHLMFNSMMIPIIIPNEEPVRHYIFRKYLDCNCRPRDDLKRLHGTKAGCRNKKKSDMLREKISPVGRCGGSGD